MGEIGDRVATHPVIGLDTSVFIYHLESHPRYRSLASEVLTGVQTGRWAAVTSVITLMEPTVRPWQLGLQSVEHEYEALLAHFPNLVLADITREVARRASQLRAQYRVLPADAIQVAAALAHGASAFVTNDRTLARAASALDVIILDNFA